MKGSVKFFNIRKGFGFIKGEDDNDYFVHYTALPKGLFLRQDDQVTFDPVEGDKGLKAENVQLAGEGAAESKSTEEAPQAEEEPAEESSEEEPAEESSEEAPAEEEKQEE